MKAHPDKYKKAPTSKQKINWTYSKIMTLHGVFEVNDPEAMKNIMGMINTSQKNI